MFRRAKIMNIFHINITFMQQILVDKARLVFHKETNSNINLSY